MHKKIMRRIIFLLATILIISSGSLVQASAATYEITGTYSWPISPPSVVVVGESLHKEVSYSIGVENIDDPNDLRYFNLEDCNMTSSNPEVLTVEYVISNWQKGVVKYESISPGTAVVTFRNEKEDFTYEWLVTVVGTDLLELEGTEGNIFQSFEMTENKESTLFHCHPDDSVISLYYGDTRLTDVSLCQINVTSSNSDIVQVEYTQGGLYLADWYDLKALKPGTATITVTINENATNSHLVGLSRSFEVTVTEAPKGPKASKPYIYSQIDAETEIYSNKIGVCFELIDDYYVEYQIYRSTSPNKNFKKIKTKRVKDYIYSDNHEGHGDDYVFWDKKVNPNKKYYYKVRARYYNKENSNKWSAFTKAKAYWTAPKPVKNFKYNEKTRKLSIPKRKNVTGYVYYCSYIEKLGYNIFGGSVYYSEDATRITKKRNITVKKLPSGNAPEEIYGVDPYVKHGKYYYIDGREPMKNINSIKYYSDKKWAS